MFRTAGSVSLHGPGWAWLDLAGPGWTSLDLAGPGPGPGLVVRDIPYNRTDTHTALHGIQWAAVVADPTPRTASPSDTWHMYVLYVELAVGGNNGDSVTQIAGIGLESLHMRKNYIFRVRFPCIAHQMWLTTEPCDHVDG